MAIAAAGCTNDEPPVVPTSPATTMPLAAADELVVRTFCGDCHAFPKPDTYPRDVWAEKVREGFHFYYESLRTDLEVPDIQAVTRFFEERAPVTLPIVASELDPSEQFLFAEPERIDIDLTFPGLASMALTKSDSPPALLLCDMRLGSIWKLSAETDQLSGDSLAQLRNSSHIQSTDLDDDGRVDFVACDLGSFLPQDHQLGGVYWLYRRETDADWESVPLLEGVGRVCDAQPGDFDGDGDIDLVVAEFGWRATGQILLLENIPDENGIPRMLPHVVDDRHGTIHVPVTDLNGDGHLDFVALISQEFEVIEFFAGRGDGTFDRQTIYQSDNPGFGSSGIQLADVDGDGDLDVLMVNGDSLDTPIAKPYHGVRWLENRGEFPFAVHEICTIPGAHCIRAADLDVDGDLDLAVVAMLPGDALREYPAGTFESVIWLEQQSDGQFVGHSLEQDRCTHAACELFDWDSDGDLDLVVGELHPTASADGQLTLFRNRLNDEAGDSQ